MKKVNREKKKIRLNSKDWQRYTLCLILMILVLVFQYFPMAGLVMAFKNYKFNLGIFKSPWLHSRHLLRN